MELTKKEKLNNLLISSAIFVMVIMFGLLLIFIILSFVNWSDRWEKERTLQFDEKYSKVCEQYNLSYLEFGMVHEARCYENNEGVLTEYFIIQKGDEYYLKE